MSCVRGIRGHVNQPKNLPSGEYKMTMRCEKALWMSHALEMNLYLFSSLLDIQHFTREERVATWETNESLHSSSFDARRHIQKYTQHSNIRKGMEWKKGYKSQGWKCVTIWPFFHLLSFQIIWTLESISVLCSRNISSLLFFLPSKLRCISKGTHKELYFPMFILFSLDFTRVSFRFGKQTSTLYYYSNISYFASWTKAQCT